MNLVLFVPKGLAQQTSDNPLNPLNDSIDNLIKTRINDDLWQSMRGDLPCLAANTECMKQLQELAVKNNLTLKNLTSTIEELNNKITEAQAANKKAIDISVFRPLVQSYLSIDTTQNQGQPQRRGFLQRVIGIFTNPGNAINEILGLVGVPILEKITGTNPEAQRNALTIKDLQIKVAELQRGKNELAEKVKDTVQVEVLSFDALSREFQISQEIANRSIARMKIIEINYQFGDSNSESYLAQLSALDEKKSQTFRSWTNMRTKLERIKMLCSSSRQSSMYTQD